MAAGNPNLKKGKKNPYYNDSVKKKIKFIRENICLKKELLAKKLDMTVGSLQVFCANNGISLNYKKNVLKFISKNKHFSTGMFVKKLHLSKAAIGKILEDSGVHDDRFSMVRIKGIKKSNKKDVVVKKEKKKVEKKERKKYEKIIESVDYQKISHDELNKILLESSDVTRKFIDDLNGLELGGALKIKFEDWKMKCNPYFYCQVKIKKFITFKLRVREIDGYYYIIKLS